MRRESRAITETVSEEGLGKTEMIFNGKPQIEGRMTGAVQEEV